MFCLLWREQGDTERCRGRQSQAGQLERHLRGCAVTRWGLLGVGVVCSFQGHLPNLTPAPILSSVYRFPRCCLMPSGYGENSRRDGQEWLCHLGSCVYSI